MLISVVTVCLNSISTIGDTLASVAVQRDANVEHIVIDGGSTDGTLDMLHRHGGRIATLVSELDQGLFDAMNKGLRRATGDVVGFLNSDDVYADDSVLREVAALFESSDADACYADLLYVAADDLTHVVRYWKSCDYRPGLLRRGWMPAHPTFFCRREVLQRVGGFDPAYGLHADFELMVRLFHTQRIRAIYVPRIWIRMRTGGASNRSVGNILRGNRESLRALHDHGIAVSVGGFVLGKLALRVPQFLARPRRSS